MKQLRLRLICLLAALLALTGTAFADMGPKPQLIVRVQNAPEVPYYLDLLAEGDYRPEDNGYGGGGAFPGLSWSYPEAEEQASLDPALLEALRAAIPDGWHACTAQGTNGPPMGGELFPESTDQDGNPLHLFHYFGLPETYRILVVTQAGEVYLSAVQTRTILQSSITLDWSARNLTAEGEAGDPDAALTAPPPWIGYLLQFSATFFPTLLAEGLLLLLFRYRWKENWKPFLLVNLLTQGGLAIFLSVQTLQQGANPWFYVFCFLPLEVLIALAEGCLYTKLLTGHKKLRAFCYGLTANAASALLGFFLAEPVWHFLVSYL